MSNVNTSEVCIGYIVRNHIERYLVARLLFGHSAVSKLHATEGVIKQPYCKFSIGIFHVLTLCTEAKEWPKDLNIVKLADYHQTTAKV